MRPRIPNFLKFAIGIACAIVFSAATKSPDMGNRESIALLHPMMTCSTRVMLELDTAGTESIGAVVIQEYHSNGYDGPRTFYAQANPPGFYHQDFYYPAPALGPLTGVSITTGYAPLYAGLAENPVNLQVNTHKYVRTADGKYCIDVGCYIDTDGCPTIFLTRVHINACGGPL